MFKSSRPAKIPAHIDLEMVRETLLYLHSDCHDHAALKGIAAALEVAIEEIDRLEVPPAPRQLTSEADAFHFLPVGL